MDFAPAYILKRLLFRVKDFFHHYYVDGTRFLFYEFINFLERIDRSVAFRITFKNFFVPLYRDYSIIGRILGILFRSIRLLGGGVIYIFLGIIFLLLILFWFLLPIILVALAFGGYSKN